MRQAYQNIAKSKQHLTKEKEIMRQACQNIAKSKQDFAKKVIKLSSVLRT
jgi:hypothetical protein